jgi:hypothetical protein
MAVALVAAVLSLVLGFSGNLTAMALLTLVALIAIAVGAFFAFRSSAAPH